jgi:hypothetical protein
VGLSMHIHHRCMNSDAKNLGVELRPSTLNMYCHVMEPVHMVWIVPWILPGLRNLRAGRLLEVCKGGCVSRERTSEIYNIRLMMQVSFLLYELKIFKSKSPNNVLHRLSYTSKIP